MKTLNFLLCFSLFLFGIQISVSANEKVDSLKQLLSGSISDSMRAEINYSICWEYMDNDQIKARKYANIAIKESNSAGYKELEAKAYNTLARIIFEESKRDSARIYYKKAYKLFEEIQDTLKAGMVLHNICICYYNRGHFKEKMDCYQRTLEIVRQYNHVKAEVIVLSNIGHLYLYMNDYENAWKYSFESESVIDKNNLEPFAFNLVLLGECYVKFKLFDKANAIFKDACQIYINQNDYTHLYPVYSLLANLKIIQEQYDSAGFYVQKIIESDKAVYTIDAFQRGLFSKYYIAVDSLDKALKYIKMNDELVEGKDDFSDIFPHYLNKSKYFRKTNQINKSLKVMQNIKPDSIMTFQNKLALYSELSEVYYQMGYVDKAFSNLKMAMQWKDSLNIQNNRIRIIESDLTYKFEREKEERAALQRQEVLKKELELSQKRKLVLLMGTVILFVLILTVIIYLNLRSKRRDNKLLLEQKAAIEEKEQLTASLLKELNHRVKNNLQMVSSLFTLQQYNTSNTKVQEALENASGRIDSITLLHQHMYKNDYELIPGVNEYLTDLCHKIIETTGLEDKVHLLMNFEDEFLDLGRMTHLGLITNELLTNSIKYGVDSNRADNSIEITFRIEKGRHVLSIKNDLNKDKSTVSDGESSKFGLKLVNTIVKQYNGSVNASFEKNARVDVAMDIKNSKVY